MNIKRGEIYYTELHKSGSVQGELRPVIIIQNDVGNLYSPTTIIVPLTTVLKKINQPTHKLIEKTEENGLRSDSMVLCEQVTTVDKKSIKKKIGYVNDEIMKHIDMAVYNAFFYRMGEKNGEQ